MIRRVFLAFLVFGLVACGESTGPESHFGTYTLQTVNGEGLPAVIDESEDPPYLREVTAGSITLNEDLSCGTSRSLRDTEDNTITGTTVSVCTYALSSEGSITLTDAANPLDPTPATGSITGSSMTLTEDGDVFVYQK